MPDFWIAIPDSSLSDEQTKRDKSIKIAQFARACSIFRVKKIYVYHDSLSQFEKDDSDLLKTILRFLDTPQYLRTTLYPRMHQLEYAGILHPIKAPHHKPPEDIKKVRAGDVRTGVLAKVKGQLFVEVVITSRKGTYFKNVEAKMVERTKNAQNILVVFGAPKHGVHDILAKEGSSVKPYEFVVNMFPNQGTETVRLEEAVLGTLAILNNSIK